MVYQIFPYIPIHYCFYHLHCGNMQSTQMRICVGTHFTFIILWYFNYCLILSLWQSIFSEKRFCQKFLGACHNLSVLYLILCFLWVKRRAFEHFFVGIVLRAVESCSFRYLVFNFYNQFSDTGVSTAMGNQPKIYSATLTTQRCQGRGAGV